MPTILAVSILKHTQIGRDERISSAPFTRYSLHCTIGRGTTHYLVMSRFLPMQRFVAILNYRTKWVKWFESSASI